MGLVCAHLQDGSVGRSQFLSAAAPLLLHTAVSGAMQEYASKGGAAEGEGAEFATLCRASAEELAHLQSFLRCEAHSSIPDLIHIDRC